MAPPRAARGSGAGSGSGGGADADARRVQELFHGVLRRCKNDALKDILSALSLKTYGRKEEMVVRVGEAVKYGADVERLQVVDGVVGKVGLGGSVGLALRELFPLVAWRERTRAGGGWQVGRGGREGRCAAGGRGGSEQGGGTKSKETSTQTVTRTPTQQERETPRDRSVGWVRRRAKRTTNRTQTTPEIPPQRL